MLRAIILGAAAGGGLPQWNCNCKVCHAVRHQEAGMPQTQSSIAVSADGDRWVLINASPDVRMQFQHTQALHPKHGIRHSPLAATILTNADVDHIAGLLTLRESQAFSLYATNRVHAALDANPVFNVLNPEHVVRQSLLTDTVFPVMDASGQDSGVRCEAFTIPGKIALWLEDPEQDNFGNQAGDTIGLALSCAGGRSRLVYLPGCADIDAGLLARLLPEDVLLFDGTTWSNHEMHEAGAGHKSAARMGHLPMSGSNGSIHRLAGTTLARRLFIHINNTNPVWLPHSPERQQLAQSGWELTCDGMELQID